MSLNVSARGNFNFCASAIAIHDSDIAPTTPAHWPILRWSQNEGNGLIHSHSLSGMSCSWGTIQ